MKKRDFILFAVMAALFSGLFAFAPGAVRAQNPQKPEVKPEDKPEEKKDQDPQQAIRIGTGLVTVPVIVTDRYGRFITGLQRDDFSVLEDGAQQKIEEFSSIESPFSVALLIDTSRSTQNKLGTIRKAALSFIKQLQPRDSVMIVTFDEKVRFVSDFTNNMNEIERAVKNLKSSYLTSLYDAIDLTIREKMAGIDGRKAIVVLTDGVDTASRNASFESTLDLISSSGIICYSIQYETRNDGGPIMKPMFIPNSSASGFTNRPVRWQDLQNPQQRPSQQGEQKDPGKPIINIPRPRTDSISTPPDSRPVRATVPSTRVNSQPARPLRDRYLVAGDYLRAVAVQSGARYIRAENIENTTFAFRLIAEELRNQYTVRYISSNELRDGTFRNISVNLNRDDLLVRARIGYRAPLTDPDDQELDKNTPTPKKP